MKKLFIYIITGIVLGVLVAFIPLTLHNSLMAPAERPKSYSYEHLGEREFEEAGMEKMQVLPLFSFILSEVFVLIVPALIVAFIIYHFLVKRSKTLKLEV
ncbi:MAG: hypothetical protein ACTSXW_08375 [Candidatus Baldrarchaeia archaeon]